MLISAATRLAATAHLADGLLLVLGFFQGAWYALKARTWT